MVIFREVILKGVSASPTIVILRVSPSVGLESKVRVSSLDTMLLKLSQAVNGMLVAAGWLEWIACGWADLRRVERARLF